MKRRRYSSPKAQQRTGLTLFELLLALAIFLSALAALSQLLASGARAASQSRLQTEAIFRCESKIGEVVAGVIPLESAPKTSFADDEQWSWSVQVQDGALQTLKLVEVRVSHAGTNALGNTSFTLRRYVGDPRLLRDEDRQMPSPARRSTTSPPAAANSNNSEDSDG